MGQKLIGKDCDLQITFGGAQDFSPNWGSSTNLMTSCRAKTISMSDSLELVETTCLSKGRVTHRSKRGSTSVQVTLGVNDGELGGDEQFFAFDTSGSFIGCYCKLEWKENAALSTWRSVIGVISEWKTSINDGQTLESFTIACDAD